MPRFHPSEAHHGPFCCSRRTRARGARTHRADAQPPFDPTPGGFRIVDAKADKGKLTWTETAAVPVEKVVDVIMVIDGKQVSVKKKVTVIEYVSVTKTGDLKGAKVTDAAGKAIEADKIAERLKETTPVVFVSGPVPAKHRDCSRTRRCSSSSRSRRDRCPCRRSRPCHQSQCRCRR